MWWCARHRTREARAFGVETTPPSAKIEPTSGWPAPPRFIELGSIELKCLVTEMIRGRRRWSPTPPPRRPSVKSEKQRQDATQRGTAKQHRPIERCQPKQPAFAHYTTDHRYARCETGSNITPARNPGCSAEVTSARKRRRAASDTRGLREGLGTLPGSVAFLPHAEAEQ